MIADELTAERIGLTWLRAALAPAGSFGRKHDESIAPYGPGDEERALAEIAAVMDLAAAVDRDGVARLRAALRAVPDPAPILARARLGDPLTDVDFYELGRFVDALDALRRASTFTALPGVDALRALLAPGRGGGEFYLADAFGADLRTARADAVRAEAVAEQFRDAALARLRDATGIEPAGDAFVVLRDVYDGPLPDDVLVVRETPTYRSAALRVAAPERDAAFARVALAEDAVRAALAEAVARESDAVAAATRALGAFDRALARAAFAHRWGGCVPMFADDRIALAGATFAPLAEALAARSRRYTPVAFELRGVAVLTGPNMGGKSAALATAAFACACAALGAPPPARSATIPLLAHVAWIGAEGPEGRGRLLSSYAAEVVRARDALAEASPRTLVLVDEFARTTGPREGRALMVAFVEALRERGAFAFVATHFDGVAETAAVAHLRIAGLPPHALDAVRASDLNAALDAINAAMDYRVVDARGDRAESDALALARLLGLDASVVERARALGESG